MDRPEIIDRIKQVIANVAGLDPQGIGDHDTWGDLNLDSLSLLEIGVDVDMAFKLGLPDESFKEIRGLDAMVELVESRLAELSGAEPVAVATTAGV
jgi:acyl carrier protein